MATSNRRVLTGTEKAAVLLLSVGEDQAAKIFSLMQDDEIRELSHAMATVGNVTNDVVEKIIVEFASAFSTSGGLVGGVDAAERMLGKVLGKERLEGLLDDIRGPAGRTLWEKLNNVNEAILANYLKNEYPQTVAVVMSKITPDHTARVLSQLPENFALEVMQRMLRMETVQKEVLDDLEKTLRNEFMSNLARTNRQDAHEQMAEVFNNLDRNAEARFMSALEERSPEAAEKIKSLMFTFEDLKSLDPSSVQTLLRNLDKDSIPKALKGAPPEIQTLFFDNMSSRAAKILKEDMEAMGPIRLREVDEAQAAIISVAKDLSNKGEIVLGDSKGEDELVY